MYDDDDEPEGPKSSATTYLSEGNVHFNQSEYKKALDSYSQVMSVFECFDNIGRNVFIEILFVLLIVHLGLGITTRIQGLSCPAIKVLFAPWRHRLSSQRRRGIVDRRPRVY